MRELTEKEKMDFREWAEGNDYLYELLCSCWKNGITTFASCGGHEKKSSVPYLGIIIDDNSLTFIKRILGELQDMENIAINPIIRHYEGQVCDDKISRGVCFFGHNHNCCEMFYKMRNGIENKENEKELNPKVNGFFNSIKRLLETSRGNLQENFDNGISSTGRAFSTKTQEFIDYQQMRRKLLYSKPIRTIIKSLPIKIFDVTKYEELQKKYGFLQRKYCGEKQESKMEQYRIDTSLQDRKKVKDVEPIQMEGVTIKTREDLKNVVEEPCLDACERLYDLNIQTIMSSANKNDVGRDGWIQIVLDSLSEENRQILLRMLEENGRIVSSSVHGMENKKIISIRTPINADTTVGDVKRDFMEIVSTLKIQDVLYGRYSYEELIETIRATYGEIDIDEELIKAMGYCYCPDENVYFENQELLNKHLRYKERVAELQK